ncbi:urease accessory protein UreD [Desulfosarcina ovata]|uniref:urease accessory protein UreD n=1 Tax=Desulfosarcina ovata TaxID=83564 RepID=UPI0012D365EC|nr:urease accessory protein UreD [Desulfosarcina ovata]
MTSAAVSQPPAAGWLAGLELGFVRRGADTRLQTNRHQGPLRVQRPLYPEPGVCHAVILHPPGGVVGGDRLEIRAAIENGAAALVTTPGATKFYRSGGALATQVNHLQVADGGCLEWLPQETIVYPGAHAATTTRIRLAADAVCMAWEVLCLGLPACGQPFMDGHFTASLEIDRRDRPLLRDRLRITGAADLNRPAGLRGHTVTATMVATGVSPEMLAALREQLAEKAGDVLTGATLMEDLLVVRCLVNCSARAKAIFQGIWSWLRPLLCGRSACVPRIWET